MTARTLFAAVLFATLCCLGTAGVAYASEAPTLEVTVVPEKGKEVQEPPITPEEIKHNADYTGGDAAESGMTVARLADLLGVAPEKILSLTVNTEFSGEKTISGKEAIDGPSPALFNTLDERSLRFVWPPRQVGEALEPHSLDGREGEAFSVTLKLEGGLLKVSQLMFSPSAPDAGTLVSFQRPEPEYGDGKKEVKDIEYLWTFGDTKSSKKPEPEHSFEPPTGATGTIPYEVEVVVTGKVGTLSVAGLQHVTVLVTVSKQQPKNPDSSDPGGEGSPSAPPSGPRSGSVDTPSIGVEPSRNAKTSHKAGASFGGGKGGSGHSGGHGTGSSGAGTGSGRAGGHGTASNGSATGSSAEASSGSADVSKSSVQSEPANVAPAPASRHPGASRGLVGVLLASNGGELPAAVLASDTSPLQATTAPLPDAAPGSGGSSGPIGLLPWAIGILAVVILVSAGGLTELHPRAGYRRVDPG